jgi:hypothetical protein
VTDVFSRAKVELVLCTQENRMVELIPSPDAVMQILKRTGAFREGLFIYPN